MIDFTQEYDREKWRDFLKDCFLPEDFRPEETPVPYTKKYTQEVTKLGECSLLGLSVFEIKHQSQNDARVGLSKETFALMRDYTVHNRALVLFVPRNNNAHYRFSFVEFTLAGTEQGKIERQYSNPRRFSWLLGKDCKLHTPEKMLITKGKVGAIEDLSSRFAIDVVTEDFYKELFAWYDTWAVDMVRFPVGSGKTAHLPKTLDEPMKKENRQHLIRLITRIIFIWFIKHKENLIPDWIFDVEELKKIIDHFDEHSAKSGSYYNAVLQNLFFATLNCEISERKFFASEDGRDGYGIKARFRDHIDNPMIEILHEEFVKKFETVPFLNGGLFECLDRREEHKEQEYKDGFSRESRRAAFVPNCLFFGDGGGAGGILEIFSRYNFTIEENTPQDIEIALDPELLGKVFENLLGTYNEETASTARNESGSFYTPREIVEYMVDSSLKEYFKGKLQIQEPEIDQQLDALFSRSVETHSFSKGQAAALVEAIYNCKILDPACGSGAFPMGILNKLVFILEKLDPENIQWKEIQIRMAMKDTETAYRTGNEEERKERIRKIQEVFDQSTGQYANYARKLYLIENCVYGVDIQPIAIQISKLRFFISLVVDQKTGGTIDNNYNILPLPNLETKFVAANTLIGIKRTQDAYHGGLADSEIEETQQQLLEIRHKHFSPRTVKEKDNLRKKDVELTGALLNLLKADGFYNATDAAQMAKWNPYDQTEPSDFFDTWWMFGIKEGFDVVIGNPPYVQLQNNHGELADRYKDCNYTTFIRTGDMYQLFYEQGANLLREYGLLCFITSNKWMRAGYGEKTRKFLTENAQTIQLIDFAGQKVFESATVDVNIILIKKTKQVHRQTNACVIKEKCLTNLTDYVRQAGTHVSFPKDGESWVILSDIEQRIKAKIERVGKPLKDWDINIYRGILTGCNEAFIIDRTTRDELIKKDSKSAKIIRPILRGRDIKRYGYDFAGLYLLYIPWHFPLQTDSTIQGASEKAEQAFIKQYPAVYDHLLQYKKELSARNKAETGIRYEWYALQRWGANYTDEFYKQKIVWKRIGSILRFCYDENKHIVLDSTCFATGKNLKYLLGVLNSKLGNYMMQDSPKTGTGDLLISVQAIEPLKVPIPNPETEQQIERLLRTKEYNEIDKIIYALYDLSIEEIYFIESQ